MQLATCIVDRTFPRSSKCCACRSRFPLDPPNHRRWSRATLILRSDLPRQKIFGHQQKKALCFRCAPAFKGVGVSFKVALSFWIFFQTCFYFHCFFVFLFFFCSCFFAFGVCLGFCFCFFTLLFVALVVAFCCCLVYRAALVAVRSTACCTAAQLAHTHVSS